MSKRTVASVIKVLEQAVKDLKKLDPKLPVVHVLMPDGCYSGDAEETFYKIDVNSSEDECDEEDKADPQYHPEVQLDLYY